MTINRLISNQGNKAFGTAQGIRSVQGVPTGQSFGCANYGPMPNLGVLDIMDFTSKATGNWNSIDLTTWNEEGYPGTGDSVIVQNTHVVTQTQNEACEELVIDAGGELDISTFNNVNTGSTTVNGNLDIGASADSGLTTVGLTFGSGSSFTSATVENSQISNSGDLTVDDSGIWDNNNRGGYTQTGSGNMANPNFSNYWYTFTQNAGVTTTLTGDARLNRDLGGDCTINGTFAIGSNQLSIGGGSTGTLIFGADSDFTGSGELRGRIDPLCTYVNNKTGACSITGTVRMIRQVAAQLAITGNFSNANYEMTSSSSNQSNFNFTSGTVNSINFEVSNSNTGDMNVINNNGNPSFNITGNVNLNNGAGTYTTTWTKGTGTIALTGGNSNIDFNAQTIEDLAVVGTTKTLTTGGFTTDSLSVLGVLDCNDNNFTVTGDLSGNGTIQSPVAATITVGGANNFTGTLTNVTIA
jgi:hypothetical protein